MTSSATVEIHRTLNIAFDDSTLSSFCFDYFRTIYDTFGSGMRKDTKIGLLLDYCARQPTGFERLLEAVRKEYSAVKQAEPGKAKSLDGRSR